MAASSKRRHASLIPLSHDHHRGLVVALRLREGYGRLEPSRAGEGVESLVKEAQTFYRESLLPHFGAEEEILFPALQTVLEPGETVIEELLADHRNIRSLIEDIPRQAGEQLRQHLRALGEALERHIRKEEGELFPIFERRVPSGRAEALGREIALVLGRAPAP
jgi:iron-sulfur cluster repair protein YtfE (RIC family)